MIELGSGWQAATCGGAGTEEATGSVVEEGTRTLGALGPTIGGEMLAGIVVGTGLVPAWVRGAVTGGPAVEGVAAPVAEEGTLASVVDVVVGTTGAGAGGVIGGIGVTDVVVGTVTVDKGSTVLALASVADADPK